MDQLSPDGSSDEDNEQRIGAVTRMIGCNEEVNGADGVKYRNAITDAYYTIVVSVNSSNGCKTWRVQQRHVIRLWACGMMHVFAKYGGCGAR